MPSVFLIGAGGLGKYHLAGLLRSAIQCNIVVVDPSEKALAQAKQIQSEHPSEHRVEYVQDIPRTERVELAIVATTAADRARVIESLLEKACTVRYMILEKVLFDRVEQYASVEKLLKTCGVVAWVNHPRRLYPFHSMLKQHVRRPLNVHVSGGARYGLMTSVLHFVDYMCYLQGSTDFEADTSLIAPDLFESKRPGYKELFGSIAIQFRDGSWGGITSLREDAPLRVSIESPTMRAALLEAEGKAFLSLKEHNWRWDEHEAPLIRQSDLTGTIAERILGKGECDLPTYEEAAREHVQVLEPVRLFLEKQGHSFESYPFT